MVSGLANWLFDPQGLTPHGFCLLWEPGLIWVHAVADAGTGLAYFTIPLALAIFVRRRTDLAFRPVFWLFAAFIVLCGAGHWLDLLTLWVPVYGFEGAVKAVTAVVSILTAVALWRLLPAAMALPSPAQLRAANAALRESEARHRARFEQSPVPLHSLDGNGNITAVSRSWLTLFGYTLQEVIGRPISDFAAPGSEAWAATDRARLMQDSESIDVERHFTRRDGALIIGLVSARLERQGNETAIVCVLSDITARRHAEEALKASEDRLQQAQKMEAIGQLTGGIAHDFNNMLQGISGGLDLMERRIADGRSSEVPRYVSLARQSVERAASLTHRMLAFARRQALLPRAVEPDSLIYGMAELIRRTVGPAITVKLRLYDGIWQALCDPHQLESALLNLAINARDAMPDGGTLTIGSANRHLTAADLALAEDAEPGDYIEISVVDTGTGMTPDVRERAFEPFFTTKPLGHGTGLGLSQIYGFVRQSNGVVRMSSEPGAGTAVLLFLPRQPSTDAVRTLPDTKDADLLEPLRGRAAPITDMAGRSVLLVEDEDAVRELITEALAQLGCNVIEARDGPSGLRIIESRASLDMMITDVGLPGLNGRQLAEAARACRPSMPILLTTGYAGMALDDLQIGPGLDVMRKPFSLDALCVRVGYLLEGAVTA